MSCVLNITQSLTNAGWVITATIASGTTLPADMFVYTNTGTTTLGTYFGLINVLDLPVVPIWTGVAIPVFGAPYVRYNTGTILVASCDNPATVISDLVANAKILSTNYQAAANSTTAYTIP